MRVFCAQRERMGETIVVLLPLVGSDQHQKVVIVPHWSRRVSCIPSSLEGILG